MGNSIDIHFGPPRTDEPPEYEELQALLKKFNTPEEETLVTEVRTHLKPEWISKNPELCDFISLACLRYRRYDVERAVKRMINYFDWRVVNIIEGLDEQDVSKDSLIDRVFNLNLGKLLPKLTQRGQSMVYIRIAKSRPDLFTSTEVLQQVHYLMLAALKRSPISQVMGIITCGDLEGATSSHLDRSLPKKIIGMVANNLPIRLAGILICHPNFMVSIVVPLAKLFMTAKMKERLKVVGDEKELIEYYGFDVDTIPNTLGGNYVIVEDGNAMPSVMNGNGIFNRNGIEGELVNKKDGKDGK